MCKLKIFACALAVSFNLLTLAKCQDDSKDDIVEPPFPQMFNPLIVSHKKIHITSEIVSDDLGYETLEEYLDVELGKQSLVSTRRDGHNAALVDAFRGYVYNYMPYRCSVTKMADTKPPGLDGFSTSIRVTVGDQQQDAEFKLFGVAALWTYASVQPKAYSYGNITYGASRDTFRRTNTWTVKDERAGILINLNFINTGFGAGQNPDSMISSIQIQSMESKKVVRTLNILSAEYDIGDEVYDGLLQVPVGYNCIPPASRPDNQNRDDEDGDQSGESHNRENWIDSSSRKMDLEITATDYGTNGSPTDEQPKRASSTLSVELAYGVAAANNKNPLQLIRYRNSSQDIKTIVHHEYNTKYIIDLRRGTCELKHIAAKVDEVDPLALKFGNGLSLKLDLEMMYEIFINEVPFRTIKRVAGTLTSMEYLYEEYTSMSLFKGQAGVSRLVRTYIDNHLSSVTIWQLDEKQRQILQSYHINVVDMRPLDLALDLTKVFDVSEECYFNNPAMVAGKDYAWVEFTYDVMSRYMDRLPERVTEMKRSAYLKWSNDYFRMPRMEFVMNDAGFILRLLVLDIPPVETIYDRQSAVISSDSEADLATLSPDLRHCSDLCRLHACKTMSFCSNSNKCVISSKAAYDLKVKADQVCTTHSLAEDRKDLAGLFNKTLHSMLSSWQTYDFESIVLPKMPEELTFPMSESGLNETAYNDLATQYLLEVIGFLMKGQVEIALFTMKVDGHLLLLLPNKFQIESDPLDEFSLRDDTSSLLNTNGKLPPFHEGLSMSRYKINSFTESQRKSSRLFSGLSYDQCALACVDARCSSFSFCNHRQECILTSINSTASAQSDNLIEHDLDCLIGQRDFLGNFNRFPNTFRPSTYASTAAGHSASECAFNCMIGGQFRCLAFSFCQPISDKLETGTCFYMKDRESTFNTNANSNPDPSLANTNATGCSHYTRSYLADFTRVESREIEPSALSQLKTTTLESKSVFECADSCINEMIDCSAFQFCFDPDSQSAMQSCTMLQSKLPADYEAKAIKNNQGDDDLEVVENAEGEVVRAGKLLKPSANCHLFAMRRDTSEAHLRELALGVKLDGEPSEQIKRPIKGMSIGGGILMYFIVAIISAAVGCGVCVARERSEFVRNKIDRVRIFVGI